MAGWPEEAQVVEIVPDVIVPEIDTRPISVTFGEGADVLTFSKKNWQPSDGRPGLKSGVDRLGRKLADDEIERGEAALLAAVEAHTKYLLTVDTSENAKTRARGDFVLGEVVAVADYFLDDDVEDENDEKFAQLKEAFAEGGDSADAMSLALLGFHALLTPLRDEIDGLGGFDVALLDEAPVLAEKLRNLPTIMPRRSPQAKAALADRNTKINQLYVHIRRLRAAAQFVFRHHPELAREARSAWDRNKRAARAKAATAKAAAVNPPV